MLTAALAVTPGWALACSSCGCTLSSDWESQGFAAKSGLRFDLRYDYLDQGQLRTGTGTVDKGSISLPTDREIEQWTHNNYVTAGIDYSPNPDWGVNLQVPFIDRAHQTIAAGDTDVSGSHTSNLGDIKLIGRYQGFSGEKNWGIQFGLKLPTGNIHETFDSGPQAGQALDRGLQPGTGSTDLILGVYHFSPLNQNWDYFVQGTVQTPLATREDFRPGNAFNANVGVRYMANDTFIPQLQLNAKHGRPDSGANADTDNSGGTLVYFSPGLTVKLSKQLNAFGFVQVPLYQNVNGYQLAPRWTASVGLRYVL